jgi:hypothetical protein
VLLVPKAGECCITCAGDPIWRAGCHGDTRGFITKTQKPRRLLSRNWSWNGLSANELEVIEESYPLRLGDSRDQEFVRFREGWPPMKKRTLVKVPRHPKVS